MGLDMQPPRDSNRQSTPKQSTLTTIDLEQIDSGVWRATQPGVALVGRGANPGRAVAHYGELVAEAVYESGLDSGDDKNESDEETAR